MLNWQSPLAGLAHTLIQIHRLVIKPVGIGRLLVHHANAPVEQALHNLCSFALLGCFCRFEWLHGDSKKLIQVY
jgi:hypothetical protein